MTGQEIEELFYRDVLDRRWWGVFPDGLEVVDKDFPETSNIYQLMPVCAKIALHMAGELPRVVFSKNAYAMSRFDSVIMNPEILSMKVSEKIRSEVFFGQYIHQLGHLCFSRGRYEHFHCTYQQKYIIHLLEDRRIEGRIVKAYPGYYYYLRAARNMVYVMARIRAEKDLRFADLEDVRWNYLATKLLYPELLSDDIFVERLSSHRNRLAWMDEMLDAVKDYAVLEPHDVYDLARKISARFLSPKEEGPKMFNFYSKVMMNLPLEVEGAPVDMDVKILDDLFLDLTKSLDLTPVSDVQERQRQQGRKREGNPLSGRYRELDAPEGGVDEMVMRRAKELAAKIRLNFLTFQAKMNKSCVFYEQESGELDEDELYQVHFNSQIFLEELPAPSALLEVVVMLDLSGSMVDEHKLEMQLVLSVALAIAFDANPDIRFSIYGHRMKQERVEIVKFYEPGKRLNLKKLFSQEGMYVNADGFAIGYGMQKFRARTQNKLLFMISDGTPTAAAGNMNPRIHVREMVREAARQGITVLSIGISNFEQSDMYDEFIPYSGPEVTMRLVQWLRRKFSNIADGATF
ncbi:MAG: VWA domain-containing protein [Odoribacter sp.]|nr:VWA domain-containing protein [Odoribacter sp.]